MQTKKTSKPKYAVLVLLMILCFVGSCTAIKDLPRATGHFKENLYVLKLDEDGFVNYPGTEVLVKTAYNYDSIMVWLKTYDNHTAASLLINGLSIWIDPQAEKNKNFGVIFPSITLSEFNKFYRHKRDTIKKEDSLSFKQFDSSEFVKTIKRRRAVLQADDKTRFAGENEAIVFIDDRNRINYAIFFSLSTIGIKDPEKFETSIGVISEYTPPPQPERQSRPPGTVGRPGDRRGHQYGRPYTMQDTRPQKELFKSINKWMVFVVSDNEIESNNNAALKSD